MAHSLRGHERSDTAAIKRVIGLRYNVSHVDVDDMVRSLRYWLKGRTLAQFARTMPFKYVFKPATKRKPTNDFRFVPTKFGIQKFRIKSRSDKHS